MVFREVLEMAFSRERSGDSWSEIGYGLWEVLEKVRITRLRGICHPRYFRGLYFVPWLFPLANLGRPTRGGPYLQRFPFPTNQRTFLSKFLNPYFYILHASVHLK